MNKIIVKNNILDNYIDNNIIIDNNHIIINNTNDYMIEYIECDKININIEINNDSMVNIYEYSNNKSLIVNNTYNINDSSFLIINKFYNNKSVNDNIVINLNNSNTKVRYNFASISTAKENYHLSINHNDKCTFSNINNRILCLNESSVDIIVDSNVMKGNVYSSLIQESRIITLGDNKCLIKPNMFIEEEQTEAKHSSVISKFKDEDIFYLMSRGIDYDEAQKLLIKGFILSNLDLKFNMREYILENLNNI